MTPHAAADVSEFCGIRCRAGVVDMGPVMLTVSLGEYGWRAEIHYRDRERQQSAPMTVYAKTFSDLEDAFRSHVLTLQFAFNRFERKGLTL